MIRLGPAAMACLRSHPRVTILLFGVETAADLASAEALGVDAVMTDSPRTLRARMAARSLVAAAPGP